MIALALMMTALPPPPVDEEVVVIARRMQMIRVAMKAPSKHGKLILRACQVTRSSGIAELDAIPCAVAQECVATGMPNRKALGACVEQGAASRVNQVAAARRAAR